VSSVVVADRVGDSPPGQTGELSVQVRLVAFDGQDPVRAAFGEVAGVLALAVQRVGGDDGVAQVADLLEQRLKAGDLARK
jgi:hypothetical protein